MAGRVSKVAPSSEALCERLVEFAPDAVVVSGTVTGAFDATATRLRRVGDKAALFVAGAAADEALARRVKGTLLPGDPVTAAETLARTRR